jgi:hypothetical protein
MARRKLIIKCENELEARATYLKEEKFKKCDV